MSDQPPPVLPESPPPVIPVAVPVQRLEYTLPGSNRRPGILTAIGVLSIILASLSGLYSLISGLQGFGFYAMSMATSRATPLRPGATATVIWPTGTMPGVPAAGATGMRPAEREAMIESLTKDKPLSPKRRRHLDA